METVTINNDIKVFYVTAKSFPEGITAAHEKIHSLVSFSTTRKYFGISRPENGVITYKAAAEEIVPGEAEQLGCDTLVLKKGNYSCITINDFKKDLSAFQIAFKKLLSQDNLDPNGYCVEWYFNADDAKCMVRLKD